MRPLIPILFALLVIVSGLLVYSFSQEGNVRHENEELKKQILDLEMALTEERKGAKIKKQEETEIEIDKEGDVVEEKSIERSFVNKRNVLCQTEDKIKPILLFVIGAEGTGHHLVSLLISKLQDAIPFAKTTQRYFAEIWEPTIDEEQKENSRAQIVKYLEQLSLDSNKIYYFQTKNFDMYSYPFDDPRNTLRRPDILDLFDLAGKFFNIKFIVTTRDPTDCVASLIRRKWWTHEMCINGVPRPSRKGLFNSIDDINKCGYVSLQARVIEDSVTYINAQLLSISSSLYRIVKYEDFLSNPTSYIKPMASFLKVNENDLSEIVKVEINTPKDYSSVFNTSQTSAVSRVFNSVRINHWSHMEREELDLKYFDSSLPNPFEGEETCQIEII